MEKKKGFTLIELLTVIAILAVILLLAMPVILGNIKKGRQKSYDNQVSFFINGAERYALEYESKLKWEPSGIPGVEVAPVTLKDLAEVDIIKLPVIDPRDGTEFPDDTIIKVYKDANGNLDFEFMDDLRIYVGRRQQYIPQDLVYGTSSIMGDVYGQNGEEDITSDIKYTCTFKEGNSEEIDVDCNILASTTKKLGDYHIRYTLSSGDKNVTAYRTVTVVQRKTPEIKVTPDNENIRVKSARVTIIYPKGVKQAIYSTLDFTNKTYTGSFDVTRNQIVKADCIDEYGLSCNTAEKRIINIQVTPPVITSTVIPNTLVNGYGTEEIVDVKFRDKKLTGEYFYVKTAKEGTSNIAVTQSCGTENEPSECKTIGATTTLLANTWYKVNGNVKITYSKTSTSNDDKIYAVISDNIAYSDIISYKLTKIDKTGPNIIYSYQYDMSNSAVIVYKLQDFETGIDEDKITCRYGENNKNFNIGVSSVTETTCLLNNLKQGTTYYYQICVKDKLNNETCRTGSTKTPTIVNPVIKFENTPAQAINGYYKKQVANVTFDNANVSVPENYIKTTRAGVSNIATLQACGTGKIPEVNKCTKSSVTNLEANTWYRVSGNVSVTYDKTSTKTDTIYAMTYDGFNYSGTTTATLSKNDGNKPTLKLNTITSKTNNIVMTYTASDSESGLDKVTCEYGTTTAYGAKVSSATTTSCVITGLKQGTTYYYRICAKDKLGNTKCVEGNKSTPAIKEPGIRFTNTPAQAINGYLSKQVATVTYDKTDISNPQYYVKTTRAGVSNVATVQVCGTGTVPSGCTDSRVTNLAANTWYRVSGNLNVTYDAHSTTNGTIYAVTNDGTNLSKTATATLSKIDKNAPTVTMRNAVAKTDRVTLTYALTDNESGVASATCEYGTTTAYGTKISSATTTSCTLTGLKKDITYYYRICAKDKLGNTGNCKTGSTKPVAISTPVIKLVSNPTSPVNGFVRQQVATVTYNGTNVANPQYYVKTTHEGVSNVATVQVCGTGAVPSGCTNSSVTNLAANTWYRVSGNVSVTYTKSSATTGTIYAVTYDGTNLSATAAATLSKRSDKPKATMTIKNGAGATVSNNGRIGKTSTTTISFGCETTSGVKAYSYKSEYDEKIQLPPESSNEPPKYTTKTKTYRTQEGLNSSISFIPSDIPTDVIEIRHTLTCTNNMGEVSDPVVITTYLVNGPTVSLTVTSKTETSINVKAAVSASTPVTYRFSTTNSFGSITPTTSNTHTFSSLSSGTKYTLWVKVTDELGQVATDSIATNTAKVCPADEKCGCHGNGHLEYNSSVDNCVCVGDNTNCGSSGGSQSTCSNQEYHSCLNAVDKKYNKCVGDRNACNINGSDCNVSCDGIYSPQYTACCGN